LCGQIEEVVFNEIILNFFVNYNRHKEEGFGEIQRFF
jgi:hypothetical protein